jgi:NitT/TauT family transport system permease protein
MTPPARAGWGTRLQGLIIPVLVIATWQAAAAAELASPHALPSPLAVATRWWQYLVSGELHRDAGASLYRVLLGFFIGAGLALPIGLLMGASPRTYRLLNPLVQVLRPIPPIAYIPLAMLWFGLGNPPAVFLIVIGAFFPVLINTISGVRHVDIVYLRAARNLGADRLTVFARVMLPAAMPYILAGMRIGLGTAFIVVIVSELIAVNSGLGYRILEAREYFWTDKVIAGMFTIGFIGLGIDTIMTAVNNHLLRWHAGLST